MADSRFINVGGQMVRQLDQPATGLGSAAETNRLLGGEYFDPNTGAQLRQYTPTAVAGNRTLAGSTSNTPGSPLPASTPAPSVSTPSPYDSFNILIGDMLKKAQGFSTADLLKQKRALERASIGRTSETTPEDLRTLSPTQQSAIRSGNVSALRPELDANAYEIEKAQQNIDNFFRIFDEVKGIGKEWADKVVAPESVLENAVKVIEANPDSMSTVLAGFNDKSKEAILGMIDYSKVGPKAEQKPLQYVAGTANQPSGVFDPNTGVFTATGGGGPAVGGTEGGYKAEVATTGRQVVNNLVGIALAHPEIFGRSAALPLPDSVRSDAFRNYEAQLDSLKGNIIPAALTAMREASKTGGALGQVSDREGAWLSSSLGALSMTQDPKQVVSQLRQIDAHLKTWQDAVTLYGGSGGSGGGTVRMKGPDGVYEVPQDKVELFKQNGYQEI